MAQIKFKDDQFGFFLWILPDSVIQHWEDLMKKGRLTEAQRDSYLVYLEGKIKQLIYYLKAATVWPPDALPMGKIIDANLYNLSVQLLEYLEKAKKENQNPPQ